jgi:hypothetical protein
MSPASGPIENGGASPVRAMAAIYAAVLAAIGLVVAIFLPAFGYIARHHLGAPVLLAATLLYGAAILAIAYVAALLGRRVAKGHTATTAANRFRRRMFAMQAIYVVTLILAIFGYRALPHGSPLVWAAAIAPALPVIGLILVMGLYLREETDELERAIQSEAALWATGGLLAMATLWGFLETFKLAPHVEGWAAVVIWSLLLGPAQIIVRRRFH